jgi:tetratricopeptide (TPR) repeat protein
MKSQNTTTEPKYRTPTKAIRLNLQDAWAYLERGSAYNQLGQNEQAIRLDPQFAFAYYNRGVVYGELGKTIEAERDIAKAKELGYDH